LGLGVAVGVISGVYIWKPSYDNHFKEKAQALKEEADKKKESTTV